mmetsp:Transcript_32949/g.92269  ORF Transcript_32949/g.92269 Transcript_32949/m.92269 type:complete len:129 (-) Transcript_32949:33-419(-)|eukprot:CAMPEP_0119129420 /NCGR_PEP_ID=MMETSP1310-20130426/7169_1 /TAXON_ID=464262 /ORGANISM="Genus nov. species nov., Strain RCC2339" /LENGTH=128 /DNA_ID=CAMNT_0007119839 /DNA_START=60 /DNA_END=446 /DNA_ORIENTATION=+
MPKAKATARGARRGKKANTLRFVIDATSPAQDGLLEPEMFEKFLHDRIKVDGKTGNLGGRVSIKRQQAKVIVTAKQPFSKRYLKYLTKKYLKRNNLRDWLRVISSDKESFELRYFNIEDDNSDDDGEE